METNEKTTRNGGFRPGQSGNPAGKPKGARNKATRTALALMEGAADEIVQAVIDEARGGNIQAARVVLDKLVPNAKDRAVRVDLPGLDTASGVADAQTEILRAVASGDLTPSEASTLSGIVEGRRKALETVELERRIEALEVLRK